VHGGTGSPDHSAFAPASAGECNFSLVLRRRLLAMAIDRNQAPPRSGKNNAHGTSEPAARSGVLPDGFKTSGFHVREASAFAHAGISHHEKHYHDVKVVF